MQIHQIKRILEAAIMVADQPLSLDQLLGLFTSEEGIDIKMLKEVLEEIAKDYQGRGIQLVEVASGFRFQTAGDLTPWLGRISIERPPRYSRALLETLALIAYRQPITRAEIEEVRGVAVSSQIIKTLMEREWVKVIGHRDVPGKPALYATTKQFLDYFNLKSLEQLPTLAELKNLDSLEQNLQIQLNIDEHRLEAPEASAEIHLTVN